MRVSVEIVDVGLSKEACMYEWKSGLVGYFLCVWIDMGGVFVVYGVRGGVVKGVGEWVSE